MFAPLSNTAAINASGRMVTGSIFDTFMSPILAVFGRFAGEMDFRDVDPGEDSLDAIIAV